MPGPEPERPAMLVVVCGTGTEVGKTWVSAALLQEWRGRGVGVAARKLAQSFAPEEAKATDAHVLGAASGEAPEVVCTRARWYGVPMAPPMAAGALGLPAPTLSELVRELVWPLDVGIGLVETAGGLCSPQAADGDGAVLARLLGADLAVLVAPAGLGVLHAVHSCMNVLAGVPTLVFLNRYDGGELHRRNRDWLVEVDGYEVVTETVELARRVVAIAGGRVSGV